MCIASVYCPCSSGEFKNGRFNLSRAVWDEIGIKVMQLEYGIIQSKMKIAKIMMVSVAFFASFYMATEMDEKAKVYATVKTPYSGIAEITCDDPAGWTFDIKASDDDGRDVVTVKITSPTEAKPPRFGVFFRVSGAGVQNVWTSDNAKEKFQLAPQQIGRAHV